MKNIILIILIGLVSSCAMQENVSKYYKKEAPTAVTADATETDSLEYQLIITDPGFESWFITRALRAAAHSESYYKSWNQWYVSEWNYLHSLGHPLLDNQIYYDPFENYGFEVNYKLYHYFLYIEDKYGIKLVNR